MFGTWLAPMRKPTGKGTTGHNNATKAQFEHRPVTHARIAQMYQYPDSFTDLLPWMEYLPEHRALLLEDGRSLGAFFELIPIPTDGRPHAFLEEARDQVQDLLTSAIPEEDEPWVLQLYVQDEHSFRGFIQRMQAQLDPQIAATPFSRRYLATLQAHLRQVCRPEGMFDDHSVTGMRWRGRTRRVRAVLYRRCTTRRQHTAGSTHFSPLGELDDACQRFTAALAAAGIHAERGDGQRFYDWLLPWFNPCPPMTEGDAYALTERMPYPGDDNLPFGLDFAASLMITPPRSDLATGTWWFDGWPHKCITVQGLRRAPEPGHFTAERSVQERTAALFDVLPEDTILNQTLVFTPQHRMLVQIARVVRAALGDGAEARLTREAGAKADEAIAQGNRIYHFTQSFLLRAPDLDQLHSRIATLNTLLVAHGITPIAEENDLLALDSYLRALPMNHDPALDKQRRRTTPVYTSHLANLMPFYGRSTGSGRAGLTFFNRAGEIVSVDPLSRADRKKNAHLLILGPTGSGKSATSVGMLLQTLAVHHPRLFIIDAGNSYGLFGAYGESLGLRVNHVELVPGADVSLPPFSSALQALEQEERGEALISEADLPDDEDDEAAAKRDPLGQMEIVARIMITGGEPDEIKRMRRADRALIRKAILHAARLVREAGRDQVITADVVHALRQLPDVNAAQQARAGEWADSLELFCSGIHGRFFNRPGRDWPDADITILELGMFAAEGYEDALSVAYVGAMNHINAVAEQNQRGTRPLITFNDEAHLISTKPLLAPYTAKVIRFWRKYGAWYWAATHSLEDFPDEARKLLNMMEWWICLAMDRDAVEQVAGFRDLTSEQKSLMLAARKEPPKYTEGAVIGAHFNALIRIVPPRIALALSMTEQDEKAARERIMREQRCSELDAAHIMAEQMQKGAQ